MAEAWTEQACKSCELLKSSVFWDIMPCSLLKVNYILEENVTFIFRICLLAACFMLIACLAYSSTLKMEATCSSKTLVDSQWTTWHYIPEDRTLHNHPVRTSSPTAALLLHQSSCQSWIIVSVSKLLRAGIAQSV
jgi:hypothetical protein